MLSLDKYIEYIKSKHIGQTRKQGTPYYLHPLEVSNILKAKGFSIEYQIAGLFHDLLEDTNTTYSEIEEISSKEIAEAVRLVTKENGYDMQEYIDRINLNEMAKMVKLADRIHNLSEAHFASKEFQNKYIEETEEWYIDLAKGTVFEEELKKKLKECIDMDCNFYLVLEKRLFCQINNKTFEYVDEKWIEADYKEVKDRLMGYDPYEHTVGNTDVLSEIEKLSEEQVIEKYGVDVINKIKCN